MSWLYRWPMHDREIVAAIVAGDPAGLAEAYDRYAPALHAYCRSLLAEPADAADAVQDTFVVAASKVDGLREPDRLRPWLYAVARNECHRRLRARARSADLDEAGEVTDDDAPEVGAAAERGELRRLVRSALAGLNPGERDVIELSLHDLEGQDLASALGVPLNQAHALASRARGQLEKSLGVLLVARTGREECPELEDILANWDGELTVLMRKRVSRHIENCDVCGERKRRELSPAMLLSALPVIFLPPGLRREVLSLVADRSPEAARYRDMVARRAGPFAVSGFPLPVGPVRTFRMPRRTILFAAAAAVLLIGGGVAAAALLHSGGGPGDASAHSAVTTGPTSPAGSASASAPAPGRSPKAKRARGTPSASPSATTPVQVVAPSPTATKTTAPAPTPTKTAKPSPTPSPTQAPGTLTEAPSDVRMTQDPTTGTYSGTFTLTASGGPVSYSISVPSSANGGLTVSPSSGTLKAGQTVTVTVSQAGNGPPNFTTTLTVNPGGIQVTVEYPPSG
jgi:RNA polymerase sigma factor (sigma-70 family)